MILHVFIFEPRNWFVKGAALTFPFGNLVSGSADLVEFFVGVITLDKWEEALIYVFIFRHQMFWCQFHLYVLRQFMENFHCLKQLVLVVSRHINYLTKANCRHLVHQLLAEDPIILLREIDSHQLHLVKLIYHWFLFFLLCIFLRSSNSSTLEVGTLTNVTTGILNL